MDKPSNLESLSEQTIPTGALCDILGVKVTADFIIKELLVEPAVVTKTGVYWKKSDIRYICYQLMQYFGGMEQDIARG